MKIVTKKEQCQWSDPEGIPCKTKTKLRVLDVPFCKKHILIMRRASEKGARKARHNVSS